MNQFFIVHTQTPWDNLKTQQLTQVRLLSLKEIFKSFPVIEKEFFDDLLSKVYSYNHYSWIKCIKRVIGPNNEDYDISYWNFLWAYDIQGRMYQFLFQKVKGGKTLSQSILVALAPPELGKLFDDYKKEAIHRILSLLNTPSKIKFLMILAPKGKSIAEQNQIFQINKKYLEKLRYIKTLANIPNIQGYWFPNFAPRCPICNELLVGIENYRIGFGKLICPRCGYEK
ncbi:MAG: hypothetical protein ACTSQJ_13675 [Promethearchaeota archaeon]